MVLLNLGIKISFRAMYGLTLLEISYLDRFFFSPILTGDNYTQFLEMQLLVILQDVPLQIRN